MALLRGNDLREMISLNGPVKAALDDWLTWNRPMLMSSYEYYQYLRDKIAPIYEEAGLPEALLFAMIACPFHKFDPRSSRSSRPRTEFMSVLRAASR